MTPSQQALPDLEINLDDLYPGVYRVELQFHDPSNHVERPRASSQATLDPAALIALQSDPKRYGAELAKQLFPADSKTLAEYRELRTITQDRDVPLRVRLSISADAAEADSFRWELLADPDTGAFLFTSPRMLLSRFLASSDFRKVKLRPKSDLTALVAVSAPRDVARLKLAEVDLPKQMAVATDNLKGLGLRTLGGDTKPVTQENLIAALREQQPDILYLVCHGAYNMGSPTLVLQKDNGLAAPAPGVIIASLIGDLPVPPRLVVLASCESAGDGGAASPEAPEAFQYAFAPLLAKVGVGAIVAMRGKVSMDTISSVMPVFFGELASTGQVDGALALARGAAFAAKREDFWMLALYMSLKHGRIWEDASTVAEKEEKAPIGEHSALGIVGWVLGKDVVQDKFAWGGSFVITLALRYASTKQGDDGDGTFSTQALAVFFVVFLVLIHYAKLAFQRFSKGRKFNA
jgi:CHAT domain